MLCACSVSSSTARFSYARDAGANRPRRSTRVDPPSADRLEGFFVGLTLVRQGAGRQQDRKVEQMTEQKAVKGPAMAPHEAAGAVTGAQSLISSLECAGVENIFGIPGGTILPAYDPLYDS